MADPAAAPAGAGTSAPADPSSATPPGASADASDRPRSPRESFGKDLPAEEPKTDGEGEPKPETPAQRRLRLKIEGQEIDYDASDEKRLTRDLQKALTADKRLQEVAAKQRSFETFLKALRADPMRVLSDPRLGLEPTQIRQAAEKLLRAQIADEMMTPEERAAAQRDAELEQFRAAEKARKQAADRAAYERLCQQQEAQYTQKFKEALDASGLPPTPQALRRLAIYQKYCNKHRIKITAQELAAKVRQDYLDEHAAVFGEFDGDKLLEVFGEKAFTKAQEAHLRRNRPRNPDGTFTAAGGQKAQNPQNPPSSQQPALANHERPHDWLKNIRRSG